MFSSVGLHRSPVSMVNPTLSSGKGRMSDGWHSNGTTEREFRPHVEERTEGRALPGPFVIDGIGGDGE
ncbi:hypothetical protein DES52_11750 [Deinococcus yavapaiensis KR-236]|uniref:Uncharacterized protein n=2 Tax=Deinococcus TaxID=1298 RepID=A0A318SHN3_9DEIO|nr:hypothetical protein DES52_11750 [Deinococcus yavapaiensis KR-236]